MRLGGPIFSTWSDPESWVRAVEDAGYSAAYSPVYEGSEEELRAFEAAARGAGIVIAEVGAWCNPIGPDEDARSEAVANCKQKLALADVIGARCCVNIAGSRGERWDGPHPDNLTGATFDLIVETVREIIDEVKPSRTFYTLETMPWVFPDSPDNYLRLIKAIDRKQFAVHLDPVNLVYSPQRYFSTGALIDECFEKLGPYIKSCHAKDVILRDDLTTHLDETRPGLGGLDYGAYLRGLDRLDADTPLMLEHLAVENDYVEAGTSIRHTAKTEGIRIR